MRKVAHILPFPAVGGTEIATRRVAHAARGSGFESIAYCRPEAEPVRELFRESGIEIAGYEPVAPSYRSFLPYLRNARRLAADFRARGVDLIHCSDILGALLAGYAGRLAGIPVLCHVRNRYREMSIRDRSFFLPVQAFAFVSRDTWAHFAHRVPETRGMVLYDGIDLPDRSPAGRHRAEIRAEFGIPASASVIGMVARVAPQKDFRTLIDAVGRLVSMHPDLRVLVVGDCSSGPAVQEHYREVGSRIAAAGLERHFVFTDYQRDVHRFFAAMDVFLLCTHWEGLPLVLLEAMAHRLPVVATAVDGVPEAVTDGETGFLHPHGDPEILAARLDRLLGDAAAREKMGAAGLDRVSREFSQERFTANLCALYSAVLDGVMPASRPALSSGGRNTLHEVMSPAASTRS
jgi:glycosyltransferase involved in cell wall biosynthesis